MIKVFLISLLLVIAGCTGLSYDYDLNCIDEVGKEICEERNELFMRVYIDCHSKGSCDYDAHVHCTLNSDSRKLNPEENYYAFTSDEVESCKVRTG